MRNRNCGFTNTELSAMLDAGFEVAFLAPCAVELHAAFSNRLR